MFISSMTHLKTKLHTYGNVANNNSKWNEYGPIYEDTDTL